MDQVLLIVPFIFSYIDNVKSLSDVLYGLRGRVFLRFFALRD